MRGKSWKRWPRASHTPTNGVQVAGVLPMRYATKTKTLGRGPSRHQRTPLCACGVRDSLPQVQRQAVAARRAAPAIRSADEGAAPARALRRVGAIIGGDRRGGGEAAAGLGGWRRPMERGR